MATNQEFSDILLKLSDLKSDFKSELFELKSDFKSELSELKSNLKLVMKDVEWIKEEDRQQNLLLEEHIKGVQVNEKRLNLEIANREEEAKEIHETLTELNERVKQVEFVPNFMINLRKIILWITPILSILGLGTAFYLNWGP